MATIEPEQLGDLGILTALYSIGTGLYKIVDSKRVSDEAIFQAGAAERSVSRSVTAATEAERQAQSEREKEREKAIELARKWGPIFGIGLGAMIIGLLTRKKRTTTRRKP